MSLTQFLSNRGIVQLFDMFFKKPKIEWDGKIRAAPLARHPQIVGTAFDYLLRFMIKWSYPGTKEREWVAEKAIKLCPASQREKLSNMIKEVKEVNQEYTQTGNISNGLLEIAVLLGKLDIIYRSGYTYQNITGTDKSEIDDLKNLVATVNIEQFRWDKYCFLNPTFGEGSILVLGADADIVQDGIIIDIKTTSKIVFSQQYFKQLVGYYLLGRIGGIHVGDDYVDGEEIEELAIYYSRYGYIFRFRIADIIDEGKIENVTELFRENIQYTRGNYIRD